MNHLRTQFNKSPWDGCGEGDAMLSSDDDPNTLREFSFCYSTEKVAMSKYHDKIWKY